MPLRYPGFALLLVTLGTFAAPATLAPPAPPPVAPGLLSGLVWRNLGPLRGGRIAAVSGAIGQPGVFYIGLPAGGVWKTTSAGETWTPIFDAITAASSVGAVEVAPSDPNVIYVGMCDLISGGGINEGNGVYKSVDAGKTWQHLGLDATKQIPSILVDPHDPNLVMIAAQGDVHNKSETRGVFRSTDGGKTWTKTLYVDDSTGLQKIAWAGDRPDVVLATSVRHYVTPITGPARVPAAAGGGGGGGAGAGGAGPTQTKLFKSTDKGLTWREITGGGLPRLTGRTSVTVAMNTNAQRMFLIGNFGLYRSDDGGTTWRQMDAADRRIANGQGGYNCGVYVDPKNPDVVYTVNTASYKSADGGNTFTGWKGAPGGDDPQQIWIDPTNGQRILMGLDQGAVVTLDGGATWSSWYNQSTDQIYHITVDNSFPYWVYGSQQDAGAVRTRSRGNLGAVTPLDWNPVSGWEWGTTIPDPLSPEVVYASGSGIVKITYPSEQWINVSPNVDPALYGRLTISQPLAFAPWNQHELIPGLQFVMATIDASHFDPAAAYVAVDFHVTGDYKPYCFRTHDYGKTWTAIVRGLPQDQPSGSFARVIREDTKKAGLLFAGTESGMYVSFDDGDDWQSLELNLPTTSYRDMVIHGNDLVVGTYGRGIWVLDDYSPLRQITPATATDPAHLFAPGDAVRVRRNVGADTPFPPEVPHALNPPDGAIIYYYLASQPAGEIALDVLDAGGAVARHLSSAAVQAVHEAAQPHQPNIWIATPQPLPTAAGTNRVNWDLRAEAPPAFTHTFEINANPGLTPPSPEGPLVPPGVYTLKLSVGDKAYTQALTVVNDPRSPARGPDLRAQYDLQTKLIAGMRAAWDGYHQVAALRAAVAADTAATLPAAVVAAARGLDSTLALVGGDPEGGRGGGGGFFGGGARPAPTFVSVDNNLVRQINTLENGDLAPTPAMQGAYVAGCKDVQTVVTTWIGIAGAPLAAFNAVLAQNNLKPVAATGRALVAPVCARS